MSASAFSIPSNPEALSQEEFSSLLDTLDDACFNEEPFIPDTMYDELLATYVRLFGARGKVGAPIRNMENKRVLQRPMPSLDKIKEDEENALNLWKARNPGPYVVSAKVDGNSVQHHHRQISTRGTGMIGGVIDHLLEHLHMPKDAGNNFVRAENVMPISSFKKHYDKEFVNPRNMVGGLCNPASTSWKTEYVQALKVLAYEFASTNPMRPSEQFLELERCGYDTTRHQLFDDVNVAMLKDLLIQWRKEEDYEMDGLVIAADVPYPHPVDNSLPDHAIAFKINGETAITNAREVEWNASKHGLLKPRVRINPVVLDGVTIEWATGHNAKFILDNDIGPDAELEVERSGSVIPYIKGVRKRAPGGAQMPTIPYEWLKRKKMAPEGSSKVPENAVLEEVDGKSYHVWYVESDVDICTIGETPEQRIKYLAEFLKKLDAKHVGEATVTKLYNAGFQTLHALFTMTPADMLKLPGFQARSAERTVNAIQGAIVNAPVARVAGASGVFGAGFGERKISSVLSKIPNLLELELPFGEMCELLHTAGLQTTAHQFAERLPAFKRWLLEHPQVTVSYASLNSPVGSSVSSPSAPRQGAMISESTPSVEATPSVASSQSLAGEVIVFSGFRSRELEDKIVASGGRVASAISGKTTILILKQVGTGKGKEQDALERGIKVFDLASFQQQYV